MDRNDCINALIATGMTCEAAAYVFHEQLAWRSAKKRVWWFKEFLASLACA